jgi:hypothetical protein
VIVTALRGQGIGSSFVETGSVRSGATAEQAERRSPGTATLSSPTASPPVLIAAYRRGALRV